jgi:hypothetical protein
MSKSEGGMCMFEIIDSKGVIHSGTEEEMTEIFRSTENSQKCKKNFLDGWEGDLKLVQVIAVTR